MKYADLYPDMFSNPDEGRCDDDLPEYYKQSYDYQYFKKEEYWYSDSNFFEDPFEKDYQEEYLSETDKKEDNYSVLGLKKSASQEDIKLAFRERALATHPDKIGGDGEEFKKVREAYENLI